MYMYKEGKGREKGRRRRRIQLNSIQLSLLRQDFVNIGLETRVRVEEFLAQAALHGGFDF